MEAHLRASLDRVENILFLHTFDREGTVDEFRESGKNDDGVLIPFPGPGVSQERLRLPYPLWRLMLVPDTSTRLHLSITFYSLFAGPMFIVGCHAYFQLFVIDPRVNRMHNYYYYTIN